MNSKNNIFGPSGTSRTDIVDHFNTMKLEAIMAYDYHVFDDPGEFLQILNEIEELHRELSHVCTKINLARERTLDILIEKNIIDG
jgi:hypothetical protein